MTSALARVQVKSYSCDLQGTELASIVSPTSFFFECVTGTALSNATGTAAAAANAAAVATLTASGDAAQQPQCVVHLSLQVLTSTAMHTCDRL